VTEWTSAYIKVWFFPRAALPDTIANNEANPNITQFGIPTAVFQGSCNIDQHFANHQIIFDTDFCGDYAGNAFAGSGCPLTANLSSWDSCVTFVGNNPQNFTETYWSINSLKVYQSHGTVPSVSSPVSSVNPPTSSLASGIGGGMGNTGTTASTSFIPALSSIVASAVPSVASCPSMNMTQFTSSAGSVYLIECDVNHALGNLPAPNGLHQDTFTGCIDACDARLGCVDLSWVSGGGACYLKASVGTASHQTGTYGAKLIITGSTSVLSSLSTTQSSTPGSSVSTSEFKSSSLAAPPSSVSATPATSSSALPGPSAISCPASNQTEYGTVSGTFHIDCGINYSSGNMPGTGQMASSFQACVDRCATTLGCKGAVSFNGACFLKATIEAMSINAADNAARLLVVAVSSEPQFSTTPISSSQLVQNVMSPVQSSGGSSQPPLSATSPPSGILSNSAQSFSSLIISPSIVIGSLSSSYMTSSPSSQNITSATQISSSVVFSTSTSPPTQTSVIPSITTSSLSTNSPRSPGVSPILSGPPSMSPIATSQTSSLSVSSPSTISSSFPTGGTPLIPSSSLLPLSSSTISAVIIGTSDVSLSISTPGPKVEVNYDPVANSSFA
jgi:hypothetical protein